MKHQFNLNPELMDQLIEIVEQKLNKMFRKGLQSGIMY